MALLSGPMLALSLSLAVGAASLVRAQEGSQTGRDRAVLPQTSPTSSPATPGELTGKERLGRKWMDEQRLDNCNVPPDKRGTTPRPDACRSAATE